MHHDVSASYDRTTKIFQHCCVSGFAGGNLCCSQHHSVLPVAVRHDSCVYAYSPRGYSLDGRSILVERLAGPVRIALDDVREVRRATPDDFRGCIRLGGSGGLFGYYGLFSTAKLGKSTWYVTNRSNSVVVITAAKTVLFSPDDPEAFSTTIRAYAPVSASSSPYSPDLRARRAPSARSEE